MIKTDYKTLREYRKLQLPDIIQIRDDAKRILNIKINSKKLKTQKKSVLKLIERYFTNVSFFNDMMPYLQFVYTIKEIKSTKVYAKFLTPFFSSSQYKMYVQNNIDVNRTVRWCHVLIDIME